MTSAAERLYRGGLRLDPADAQDRPMYPAAKVPFIASILASMNSAEEAR